MSSQLFTSPVPDGWWPQLSPNGRHVAFGHAAISVANLKTGAAKVSISVGRRAHWLDQQTLMFWTDGGRFLARKPGGWVPGYQDRFTGNTTVARDGHWLTWESGRLVFDGALIAQHGGRVADTSQGYVVYANQQGTAITLLNGPEYHVPEEPHVIYFRYPYVSYGYWGAVRLLNLETGEDMDATVTPWKQETPAVPFMVDGVLWLATATENPKSGQGVVLLRPHGEKDCLVLGTPGTSGLDVCSSAKWLPDGAVLVAASGDTGQMSVWRADTNEARVSL